MVRSWFAEEGETARLGLMNKVLDDVSVQMSQTEMKLEALLNNMRTLSGGNGGEACGMVSSEKVTDDSINGRTKEHDALGGDSNMSGHRS